MSHKTHQTCIEACQTCAAECEHCASACLDEEDVGAMARCIQLDHDCAEICALTARYLARGSEFALDLCELCAEICRDCAEECRKHEHDHCQHCAEACEGCAEECDKMVAEENATER